MCVWGGRGLCCDYFSSANAVCFIKEESSVRENGYFKPLPPKLQVGKESGEKTVRKGKGHLCLSPHLFLDLAAKFAQ